MSSTNSKILIFQNSTSKLNFFGPKIGRRSFLFVKSDSTFKMKSEKFLFEGLISFVEGVMLKTKNEFSTFSKNADFEYIWLFWLTKVLNHMVLNFVLVVIDHAASDENKRIENKPALCFVPS